MNCSICDYPLVWNDERHRHWCSVYGDHRAPFQGRNVIVGARVEGAVTRVDFDRERRLMSRRCQHISTALSPSVSPCHTGTMNP